MNTRLFILILLVPAFFLSGSAFAQQGGGPIGPITVPVDSPELQKIEFMLGAYHELPARQSFEEVTGARDILAALATDRTAPRLQKRAIEALAYWPDSATLSLFEGVLSDPRTRMGTRHFTILLIGKTFGTDGLDVVAPYLASNDLQLRLTAVDAVAATRSDRGFDLLKARAKVEPSSVVLERIEEMGSRLR